jgi:hypothetical protein
MKADKAVEKPSPPLVALRRAARGVLQQAVDTNSPIPIWNGTTTVWEVPEKQLEQLDALESSSADAAQDQ